MTEELLAKASDMGIEVNFIKNAYPTSKKFFYLYISKLRLDEKQVESILNTVKSAENFNLKNSIYAGDWQIQDCGPVITGMTSNDRFNILELFDRLHIPSRSIYLEYYC